MNRLESYIKQPAQLVLMFVMVTHCLYGSAAAAESAGLVGYWKLDEAFGKIAFDSSGNSNDGEIFGGVTWAPYEGKFDGAALFNGRTFCRILIPTADVSPTAATISFWANLCEPQNLVHPAGGQYRFFFSNNRRIRTEQPESLKITERRPGRIHLFMDKGDTNLDLGLGDTHWRHRNITNLEIGRWYHLVLTCDRGDYTVYVNGIRKAADKYSGFKMFPSHIDVGNNGTSHEQAFFGLIDDFAVFRRALGRDEVAQLYLSGVEALVQKSASRAATAGMQQATRFLETAKPLGAIAVLTKEIARLQQQAEENPGKMGFYQRNAAFEHYFLLARAKQAAAFSMADITKAYRQAIFRLVVSNPNALVPLQWLFEHTPATEFARTLKQVLSNSTNKQYVLASIARQIEVNDNWPFFEAFSRAVFAEIENVPDAARWIEFGLEEQGPWKKKYLEFCRGTANSAAYAFGNDCSSADTCTAEGNYKEAIKQYEDLMQLYNSPVFRAQLTVKICKCLLRAGEYENAIGKLERLLADSDRLSDLVTKEATIIKTYCHIRSAATDKALSDLRRLAQDEPTPDISLLLGYCYSLEEDYTKATEILNGVLRDCPDSSYALKAQMCLDRIGYMSD